MIIEEICDHADLNGDFAVSLEVGNQDGTTTAIVVCGRTEWDGYQETDYLNGTGNWVTVYADVRISSVETSVYGNDGEELEVDGIGIDERYIESEVIERLMS